MRYAYTQLETSPVYEGTNRINGLRKHITADFYFYAGPRFTGTEAQSFILLSAGKKNKEIRTLERLAKIGLAEGVEFDLTQISAAKKTAMEKSFEKAKQRVKQAFREYSTNMNSWMVTVGMGNYGTNYMMRAVIADYGYGGPEAKSHLGGSPVI